MGTLAVIVVNYQTPDLTILCVEALAAARAAFSDFHAIVVDGGSADHSVETMRAAFHGQSWVTLLPLEINGGFAFANNRAIIHLAAGGLLPDFIALINPDAQVRPGALEKLAALLDDFPNAGAVGALLEHSDGRPQGSAFNWPSLRGEFCRGARTGFLNHILRVPADSINLSAASKVPWVTGAGVMFRTAAIVRGGLFDEGFFLYFEETELMKRITMDGWDIWHEPAARVIHMSGASTKLRDPETGLLPSKRIPRYWFESRRRYFSIVGGRRHALLASLLWLLGHLVYVTRRALISAPADGPLRPARDMVRFGFLPSRKDATLATPELNALPPAQPAWMKPPR